MGELPNYTGDIESSSDPEKEGKDSKKEKDARSFRPIVPPLDLLRRSEIPAPMPRAPLEGVLGGVFEKKSDSEEDDEEEAETSEESKEKSVESDTEQDEVAAADDQEQSDEQAPTDDVPESAEAQPEPSAYEGELYIQREGVPVIAEADSEEEPVQPAFTSTTTPPPPPPPAPPMPEAQWPNPNQGPGPQPELSQDTYTPPSVTVEQHEAELHDTEYYAEKRGLRRGLIAGFITGYVVKAYLAHRKNERYEKAVEKQINQRDEQIAHLQREQHLSNERMTAQFEDYKRRQEQLANGQTQRYEQSAPAGAQAPETRPEAAPKSPEEQIFDMEGNEIILLPGWHVERSAGGYSVVLDEHNRVVHDAIRYGEAFRRDQKREQLSDDLFAAIGGGTPVGGPQDAAAPPTVAMPAPRSWQQPQAGLSGQQPTVDVQHRLPKPRNQAVATITSPWLWAAIAILIIIYFIASLV